jgi:hypothetical protein
MANTVSFEDAINALRTWHYSEVRSIADEAIREMHDAKPDDRDEWLNDWLHETIDSHQHVIYTAMAKATLLASDNEDAYEQEIGSTDGSTIEGRAFCAIMADVREHLDARRDEWDVDSDTGEDE